MGGMAFMAGLGTGFLDETEKVRQRSRQQKKDAQDTEIHDARMKEVRDAQDLQASLKDAARPVDVQGGANGQLIAPSADNRDVGLPDGPTLDNGGMSNQAYRVGAQPFSEPTAANAAATAANAPEAVMARTVQAYRTAGKPLEALNMKNAARTDAAGDRTELDEMANRLMDKKLEANGGDIFKTAAQLGTNSQMGPLAGMTVESVPSADAKTMNIVGTKDGAQQIIKSYTNDALGKQQAYADMMKMPATQRLTMLHDDFKSNLLAKDDVRKETKLGLDITKNAADVTYLGKHGNYLDAMGGAAGTKADASMLKAEGGGGGGKAPLYERMDEVDRNAHKTALKQVEETDKAITKATLDGGDAATLKSLQTRLAVQKQSVSAIEGRYRDTAAGSGMPNPMGYKGSAFAGGATAARTPSAADQKRLDNTQAGLQRNELAKRKAILADPTATPEQKQSASQDIVSLNKELRGSKADAPVENETPEQLAAAAPPVKSAPMAATAGAPAKVEKAAPAKVQDKPSVPAVPNNPTEKVGQDLDAARAAVKELTRKPPGLAAGRAAMDAHAAKVTEAKKVAADLAKKYEAMVPQQAYVSTKIN
jgi:hypothetical protein